jgi:hypothetical protein
MAAAKETRKSRVLIKIMDKSGYGTLTLNGMSIYQPVRTACRIERR